MKRKYSHIKHFEKEINEMFNNGMTLREIGERLGFTRKQMIDYRTRYTSRKETKLHHLQYCKIIFL